MSPDMQQFLQTFFDESFEGLDVMESGLLNMDVGDTDAETVNEIFRAAHSIKGGSATFGLTEVASFTHHMETFLDEIREGKRTPDQNSVDLLLASVDSLREMLSASRDGGDYDVERVADLEKQFEALMNAEPTQSSAAPAEPGAAASSTPSGGGSGWKIVFRPHDNLFLTGNDPARIFRELADYGELTAEVDGELLPNLQELDPERSYLSWTLYLKGDAPLSAVEEAFAWVEDECDLVIQPWQSEVETEAAESVASSADSELANEKEVSGELVVERRRSADRRKADRRGNASADTGSIRVNIEKIDAIINMVGELVITQSMLSTLGENFDMSKMQKLRDGLVQLERNTRELQEDVMRMRMLPISHVFHRFPRMIHDLSHKLGKEIELVMLGEGTELDKTLVEKISDPLVHLVRNAVDHGVEPIAERRAAGKSETGIVTLNAYHKGGNIVIEVKDDGRGLYPDKIRAKAVEKGLISEDTVLSREQTFDLLFAPGFSTAAVVSDVSGRGVGMDVVRKNIQSLNGTVDISSEPGKGSTFTVRLPLTLAILDGQTVVVGDETYIVPLISISESIQVKRGMVNHVAGQGETFQWRGEYLPVIRLGDLFGAKARAHELTEGILVVVEGDGRNVGLFVDDLLGQQQVVIKSMEENYQRIDGISGATILGDGSVALILDIPGLIRLSTGENDTVSGHASNF